MLFAASATYCLLHWPGQNELITITITITIQLDN